MAAAGGRGGSITSLGRIAAGATRSAGGEPAATAGRPPRRRQTQPIDAATRLHLLEDALVAGAVDTPGPVLLHVLVVVEGAAADRQFEVGHHDDIVERPHTVGGVRAGEIDLRVMHLVTRV